MVLSLVWDAFFGLLGTNPNLVANHCRLTSRPNYICYHRTTALNVVIYACSGWISVRIINRKRFWTKFSFKLQFSKDVPHNADPSRPPKSRIQVITIQKLYTPAPFRLQWAYCCILEHLEWAQRRPRCITGYCRDRIPTWPTDTTDWPPGPTTFVTTIATHQTLSYTPIVDE